MNHSAPPPLDDQLCYAIYSAGIAIQRTYKPWLDALGLTYPQYLVLNLLWAEDGQLVGRLAERLALESSTLTPLLQRLEAAGLVNRTRDPANARQVIVALTDAGRAMQQKAGCLGAALLEASGQSPEALNALNDKVRTLRNDIYSAIGGWGPGAPAPEADQQS
ncbi:MarR family winged helix-turn-helix transcriptional regulator [Caulobacter sp. UNC279MFTsu5.1]|uniref:MarR family winged helix-turn-helix transcriptional regulator n=1 Tax=Caulobacter sp. UNC279MFTsu5.1 TaxID=1502775 RepID=UPI0003809E82|nr:MarR family transcriptional regulator [Caulobacter sp. UNC279MFTsu5.1]SFK04747.1 DNA-binding transcriptional regulator, MarR family [Caulobacter sp. UNC279MFTsu5.1]